MDKNSEWVCYSTLEKWTGCIIEQRKEKAQTKKQKIYTKRLSDGKEQAEDVNQQDLLYWSAEVNQL